MTHETQCQRILELLRNAGGRWVSLTAILALGIAQYNSRIHDLRTEGHDIENRTEWTQERTRHSWYRLKEQGRLFPGEAR